MTYDEDIKRKVELRIYSTDRARLLAALREAKTDYEALIATTEFLSGQGMRTFYGWEQALDYHKRLTNRAVFECQR